MTITIGQRRTITAWWVFFRSSGCDFVEPSDLVEWIEEAEEDLSRADRITRNLCMALKSIEEEWSGFAEMVFANTTPSEVQVSEMRKAFFGGAWAMFTAIAEIGEPHISEDEGCQYLDDRKAECEAFKSQLMAEYSERN